MLLLLIVVLFWGSSWYAIALQVGDVPVTTSIAWRFGVAGIALYAWLASRGELAAVPRRLWPRVALLGACLFSANYLAFYHATAHLASGLVAVVFATAGFVNVANQALWHRARPSARTLAGAGMGVGGIALTFVPSILAGDGGVGGAVGPGVVAGLGLSLLGTWLFSNGNLVSASLSREAHLPSAIAAAMLCGTAICTGAALALGDPLGLPADPVYLGALLYLAIGASVIGFVAYLTLVAREGAARAGYATVLFPLVALGISTLAEGYAWSATSVAGVALALGGAAVTFRRASR